MRRRPPKPTLFPYFSLFFFNDTATTEIYTLSLHDALPISGGSRHARRRVHRDRELLHRPVTTRSEEHTSELQSPCNLVCRLLLEKKEPWRHCVRRHTGPIAGRRGRAQGMAGGLSSSIFLFFNDTATTEIYTLSLHDALPISAAGLEREPTGGGRGGERPQSATVG